MSRIPVPSNHSSYSNLRQSSSPTPYQNPVAPANPTVERSLSPLPGHLKRQGTAPTNNMSTVSGFSLASDPRKKQTKRDEVRMCSGSSTRGTDRALLPLETLLFSHRLSGRRSKMSSLASAQSRRPTSWHRAGTVEEERPLQPRELSLR